MKKEEAIRIYVEAQVLPAASDLCSLRVCWGSSQTESGARYLMRHATARVRVLRRAADGCGVDCCVRACACVCVEGGGGQMTGSSVIIVCTEEHAEHYAQQLKRQQIYAKIEKDE